MENPISVGDTDRVEKEPNREIRKGLMNKKSNHYNGVIK